MPPFVGPDVLILAAFDPELAALRAALGDGRAVVAGAAGDGVGGLSVACRVVGIGLPAAAAGAATLLGEREVRAVVLVGTCGAYRSAHRAIGDVVVPQRLRLVDPASLEGETEFPPPMAVACEADPLLLEGLTAAGGPAASSPRTLCVATTLAITVDDARAARIAERAGANLEHLETHGVALACAARGVPFAAVLAVANFVGSSGRAEWQAHHRSAEAAAGERVLRWLRDGAKGLPLAPRVSRLD